MHIFSGANSFAQTRGKTEISTAVVAENINDHCV